MSKEPSAILLVDRQRLSVAVEGRPVRLTGLQLKLLLHLFDHPERLFTPDELLAAVWPGGRDTGARNVVVAVSRLKRALGPAGALIECVRYFGYRLTWLPAADVDRTSQEQQKGRSDR